MWNFMLKSGYRYDGRVYAKKPSHGKGGSCLNQKDLEDDVVWVEVVGVEVVVVAPFLKFVFHGVVEGIVCG